MFLPSAMIGVTLATEKTSDVLFGNSELCGQWGSGRGRRRYLDEGEAPARTAFRRAAHVIRHSPVHRGIRLAGIGWDSFPRGDARHGGGVHALCAGAPAVFAAAQRAAVRAGREEPPAHGAVPRARRSNHALYSVGAYGVPIAVVRSGKQH